jgi:hypothetical protein
MSISATYRINSANADIIGHALHTKQYLQVIKTSTFIMQRPVLKAVDVVTEEPAQRRRFSKV